MINQKRAYIYAGVAVLFWSTSASAFKICLSADGLNVGVLPLLFFASVVSTAAFFIYLSCSRKLALVRALSRKQIMHSALLGFLNPFLYYTVLLKAYSVLPAQQAQPLNFLWPVMLVLLSIPLLGQKVRAKDILAIIVSFLGVIIISTEGDVLGLRFTNPLGALLATSSSLVWALFWIYNTKDKLDEAVRLFVNFAFGSVYVFVAMVLLGAATIPNWKGLLGAAYVGLFETGITFLLWLRTLRLSASTARVANLIFLVPVGSLVVIYFVLGERILPATVLGLLFILGGIALQRVSLARLG